jgi:cytoskeleton protein RodZ
MQSEQAGPARAGERELVFRFDADSWVEIRDRDNKIIFSKLNRAGAEERVAGAPPLRLVVGNARNVHLTYGARPVDLTPHTGVTVARLTVE